jgi:hypothetical protein
MRMTSGKTAFLFGEVTRPQSLLRRSMLVHLLREAGRGLRQFAWIALVRVGTIQGFEHPGCLCGYFKRH